MWIYTKISICYRVGSYDNIFGKSRKRDDCFRNGCRTGGG